MRDQHSFPDWLNAAYSRCPQAIARVRQAETVSVEDACMRVTSEAVVARGAVPPCDVAACDGYALRAADVNFTQPVHASKLRVDRALASASRRVADPWIHVLEPGAAAEMHAYGPLPVSADTLVASDPALAHDAVWNERIVLQRPLVRGACVIGKGSQYAVGDTLLTNGQRITPERQAVLIAAGVRELKVSKRPRIGILVSSYDRRPPLASRKDWQTPDTCGPYIRALLQRWGFGEVRIEHLSPPPTAGLSTQAQRDAERAYRQRVIKLQEQYDLIIGCGMLSTRPFQLLGLNCVSWFGASSFNDVTEIRQTPGERFNVGVGQDRSPPYTEVFNFIDAHGIPRGSRSVLHRDQATLINLPGFLSSVAVLMHVVVRRVLDLYEFVDMPGPHWEIGELARAVQCDSEINLMLWAKIVWGPRGEPLIDPLPDQAPHRIGAFLDAEVIAAIPACPGRLAAGSRIHFLRLDPMRQPAEPNCALAEPIPIVTGANPSTESSMEAESMEQPQLDVTQSWAHLEAWLQAQPRAIPGGFNAGASDDDIKILEGALGVKLPQDFVESLKRHNGQADQGGVCFEGESLLDIQGILSEWTTWRELVVEGEFDGMTSDPDAGVKDDWYNLKWIPLTRNGMGDGLCIDLDPAPGGTVGQVIRMLHDDDRRERVAASFTQWLSRHVVATIGLEEREE
ncbi:SMI1/KNR4 family protein [Trinickia sp. Y13]|nr:SMI1/KNR4 family protein [Trinickia sp. Y13]MDG0026541.1 SMI1/KNR4 family protein [Trinickia sp. Y13]